MHEALPIRGLTIIQPWAHLIASGQKTIETRRYPTKFRGWLLIHAGLKWSKWEQMVAVQLLTSGAMIPDATPVLGAVVAVARLARCEPFRDTPREIRNATSKLLRARGGISNPDLDAEITPGYDFLGLRGFTGEEVPGLWSWHLEDVIALPTPVPWTGAQGLWIPKDVAGALHIDQQLHKAKHPSANALIPF